MKQLLIILFMPLISMAQQTYVPDDNFEAALEYMGIGNGIPNDNYVTTANISNVIDLDLNNQNIYDLTGIEDFTSLEYLGIRNNYIKSLDLSNNLNLDYFELDNNPLSCLNIANGNNYGTPGSMSDCSLTGVPSLNCITVDSNVSFPGLAIRHLDSHLFNAGPCVPCNTTVNSISEANPYRKVVRVIDLFGREVINYNQVVFFIYDDGTVERKVIIKP
tara:strand:+ start:13316 stop:13969 length:654 start_codon:yes stop_codon:yes gene_type:complete